MVSDLYPISTMWKRGFHDGLSGAFNKQLAIDYPEYRDGFEAGEASASGDCDNLSDEERREIYGDERF